jgi:hypothetical protein
VIDMLERTDVEHSTTRELIERAGTYAGADILYPTVVGGMIRWTMTSYLEQGMEADALSVASAVIEHAEARGWRLDQDGRGFHHPVVPEHDQEVIVYRANASASWQLLGARSSFAAVDRDKVMIRAAQEVVERPGVRITYCDDGALNKRTMP